MAQTIRAKTKRFVGKLPTKRSVNLALAGEVTINWKVAVPAIIVIVIAAALFGKFGVYDRMVAVSEAEAKVSSLQSSVDAGLATIASYADVTEKYAHYTYGDMTDEELNRTDREEAIAVLDSLTENGAVIGSFTITGNTIVVPITGSTLEHISEIVASLEADPLVSYVQVSTAATNTQKNSEEYDMVVGQMTIYLHSTAVEEEAAE